MGGLQLPVTSAAEDLMPSSDHCGQQKSQIMQGDYGYGEWKL